MSAAEASTHVVAPPPWRRTLLAIVAIALAAAGAAYSVYWFKLTDRVKANVVAWLDERAAEGFEVNYTAIRTQGFPFGIRVKVDNPTFGRPKAVRGWEWRGKRIVVRVSPWDLSQATVSLIGRHKLDVATPDGVLALTGETRTVDAEIKVVRGLTDSVAVLIENLEFYPEEPYSAEREASTLKVRKAEATFRRPPPATGAAPRPVTLAAEIAIEDMRLPHAAGLPLGRDVSAASATIRVLGEVPKEPWPGAVAVWSEQGGTVEIEALNVVYGPLRLRGNGTLALDRELQPIGAFSATAQGFYETVDALRERGLVRGRDATAARFVLGALAKQPADGGPAVLEVALTIQDRRLYTGPVRLMELGRIRWQRTPLR